MTTRASNPMQTRTRLLLAAKGLRGLLKWVHLIASIALIFGLAYFLGYDLLSGSFKGNDSPMHLAYALWVDEFFPHIPHWYPLQGGGESILHGYPLLGHVMVVLVSRMSNLSVLQAFRLVSFLSFPLAALGIYFFCWMTLKKQSVGLIAAVFYLLAPITWTWAYDWGFFGQVVGIVFVPISLICFDGYLSNRINRQKRGLGRLWQAGLIFTLIFAGLSHPVAGAGAGLGMIAYTALLSLVTRQGRRSRVLAYGLKGIVSSGILAGLTLAVYLLPLYSYGQVANREGLNVLGLHQLPRVSIVHFLGLQHPDPLQILTRMANPLALVVFVPIAIALSGRTSRPALAWSLVAGLMTLPAVIPEIPEAVSGASSLLALFFSFRSALVLVMVILPVAAAYGAWAVADLFVWSIRGGDRRSEQAAQDELGLAVWPRLSSVLAALVVMVAIVRLGRAASGESYRLMYGPTPAGIDLRDVWNQRANDACLGADMAPVAVGLCEMPEARAKLNIQEFMEQCDRARDEGLELPGLCRSTAPTVAELRAFLADCEADPSGNPQPDPCNARVQSGLAALLGGWPPVHLSDHDPSIQRSQALAQWLPDQPMLRIDVSPLEGRLAEDITAYSQASQIEAYTQQLSLIHLMWGYQLGVFYSDQYGSPTALNDLADWMGIHYVFLDPQGDPVRKFEAAGWSRIQGDAEVELWRYGAAPPLATASSNPAILVLTDPTSGNFAQLFRMANEGLALYSDYSLVESHHRIGELSVDELGRFDIVLMHGYQYRNSEKAWALLEEYVRSGGSLYVDTGWQYVVPEWEFEQAPAVLPVHRLTWSDHGKVSEYQLNNSTIAGELDVQDFGPLIWEEEAWGVSGASLEDLRDWGQPVLSVQDHPLIAAGELGEGRVVWSGMNLVSHIVAYDNREEAQLLHNILDWLAQGKNGIDLSAPTVARDHPDQVFFSLATQPGDVTWLYWREAYYPNWHAYVTDSSGPREMPIYRGGPGFMLMPIETTDPQATVTLRWELPLIEHLAVAASALGILLLVALIADGLFLQGNGFTWLRIGLVMRIPRPFLGEGSNLEWAEQKRAELEAGQLSADTPPHLIPSQAIAWWRGDHRAARDSAIADGQSADPAKAPAPDVDSQGAIPAKLPEPESDGHQPEHAPPIEAPSDATEQALLESWLNGSGHDDDAWAQKLLGRKKPIAGD